MMYQDYYNCHITPNRRRRFERCSPRSYSVPLRSKNSRVPRDTVLYCTSRAKAFDCVRFNGQTLKHLDPVEQSHLLLLHECIVLRRFVSRARIRGTASQGGPRARDRTNEHGLSATFAFSLTHRGGTIGPGCFNLDRSFLRRRTRVRCTLKQARSFARSRFFALLASSSGHIRPAPGSFRLRAQRRSTFRRAHVEKDLILSRQLIPAAGGPLPRSVSVTRRRMSICFPAYDVSAIWSDDVSRSIGLL